MTMCILAAAGRAKLMQKNKRLFALCRRQNSALLFPSLGEGHLLFPSVIIILSKKYDFQVNFQVRPKNLEWLLLLRHGKTAMPPAEARQGAALFFVKSKCRLGPFSHFLCVV